MVYSAVAILTFTLLAVLQAPTDAFVVPPRHTYGSPYPISASIRAADALCAVKIIIAGAPASGKGTQCEKIKEEFGVVHLSTGDMLRAAVAAGTEVGKEAKSYMDSGKLVPDSTIIGVVCDLRELS